MSILVTGGAGFIGSHTCVELLNHGYRRLLWWIILQQLYGILEPCQRTNRKRAEILRM